MKSVLKITGGKKLSGSIDISGSKNAAVALIPASILGQQPITIVGVPQISDVKALTELLLALNVNVYFKADNHIIIDQINIQNMPLIDESVNKLRASYYFMGALLGRFGQAKVKMPGGCYLGPRPIDLHLNGFEALGAEISSEDGCYVLKAKKLKGNKIFLDFASVGATINIMCAAVYAEGKTIIENAAKEPEIIDMATMLNKMGAKIRGAGTNVITIEGVNYLGGCFHEIIPDRIEAATYITLAATVGENITINNIIPQHIEGLLAKLDDIGINIDVFLDRVTVKSSKENLKSIAIKTGTYPGFATDIQQIVTVLLTQCVGQSIITETVYPERFKHCHELNKMGANIDVRIASSLINGPTKLRGTTVTATDLRCGAALVIAGLLAEGETIIENIYHIERGYENIVEKLKSLGASIEKVEVL